MSRPPSRGYALVELLIAMVLAGIIGVALTRLVVSQARFVSGQDGIMRARASARSGLNVATDELRMVSPEGLLQANRDSFTVRAPYAYGIACGQVGGATIVMVFPADSAAYAAAVPSGYAWRDSSGTFVAQALTNLVVAGSNPCPSASPAIAVFTNSYWSPTLVALTPSNVATPVGAVVYLYQTIRYAFAPSGVLTGRRALWRSVIGATTQRDELVTPYDGSTHFEYLIGDTLGAIHTPSPLTDVRAVRFKVIGASENAPEGKTAPTTFNLTTDLYFRNRAN